MTQRVDNIIQELKKAINAEYDAWFDRDDRNREIKRVCLNMVKANHFDTNPYELCMGHPGSAPCYSVKGTVSILYPIQPVWAAYFLDATAAIDATKKETE